MSGRVKSRRIQSLDTARGLAILIAIANHMRQAVELPMGSETTTRAIWSFVFQAATPTFLFLFGVMIELVYVRMASDDRRAPEVRTRLVRRAFQCHVAMAIAAFVAFLVGQGTATVAIRSLLMLEVPIAFSSVLRYYTFAILLTVLYVAARRRVGIGLAVALLAAVWLPRLFGSVPPIAPTLSGLDQLGAFLVGRPGPDLFCLTYTSTLPLLGMLAGWALVRWQDTELPRDILLGAAMIGVGAIGVLAALPWYSAVEIVEGFAFGPFRRGFHPMYFAVGMMLAGSLVIFCARVVDRIEAIAPLREAFRTVGTSSLVAFAVGNSVSVAMAGLRPVASAPLLMVLGMTLFAVIVWVLPEAQERARLATRRILSPA